MKKNVNGIEIEMTSAEIAEFNSRQITVNEFDIYIKGFCHFLWICQKFFLYLININN